MPRIEVVFFDLGDTIVDLREGHGDYMARVVARAERVYDVIAPRCQIPLERNAFAEWLAQGTEDFYLEATARQQGVDIYDALRHLFDAMGIPADDGLVRSGGDAFCRGSSAPAPHGLATAGLAPLRTGAREVLTALSAQGLRLGVISNTLQPGSCADEALERRGLLHLFEARIYSSEMRVAKPHAAIFGDALDAVSVAPNRAAHVGDRLMADVAGAQAVGMKAVLIEVPNRPEPNLDIVPDARIRELPELLHLLPGLSK
jgi:HAD superfamily hydrolase (TIGR01509 family)